MEFEDLRIGLKRVTGGAFLLISEEEYEAKYGGEKPLLELPIRQKEDVSRIRHAVDAFLQKSFANWNGSTRQRALLALSEAVTNVVKHTPGGWMELYVEDEVPRFHIIDRGEGLPLSDFPYLFFVKGYTTSQSLGAGFSVLMQCAGKIELCTSKRGTKIVLRCNLTGLQK